MSQGLLRLAIGLAFCTLLIPEAAQCERFWVNLPRVDRAVVEDSELPYPPQPTLRALERRAAKGRPDMVSTLQQGPDPYALEQLRQTGVEIHSVSRWLCAASVEASVQQVVHIRQLFGAGSVHRVRSLRGDRDLTPSALPIPTRRDRAAQALDYGPSAKQLEQSQIDLLHAEGFTGRGVRVLLLDTGFRLEHEAFAQLDVHSEWDFVHDDADTGNEAADPAFQDRHGTGVLGTLAGWAPGDLIGGAFEAEFLLAKTEWVATETRVEEDDFVAALEWGEALGADMMSASLGYKSFPDEPDSFTYTILDLDGDTAVTTRALDDLVAMGVVSMTSIGNSGPDPSTLISPADGDSVLAIGAVDSLDVLATFSSRGPTGDGRLKPDLLARGVKTVWSEADGGFSAVSGTSLAAPVAASGIALVLEAHPEWGPGQVIDAVRMTATQYASPDNNHGYGTLRARDAVWNISAPVVPMPFTLVEPADSASVAGAPIGFRWNRAQDAQTPLAIGYRIHFASSADFADTVAVFDAGFDSTRALSHVPDGTHWWRVIAEDPDHWVRVSEGRLVTVSGATSIGAQTQVSWVGWSKPSPNPASDSTSTLIWLRRPAQIEVTVYDVSGRRVRRVASGRSLPVGEKLIQWDGIDDQGRRVSSGVYLLRAVARDSAGNASILTSRFTLLR